MATFNSDKSQSTVTVREPSSAGVTCVVADLTVTAAATNDVFQMVKVEKGVTVYEVILVAGDIDSGTALVMTVGDGGDTDRFITLSTVGQAGGITRMNNQAGAGYTYSADDTIDILVTTGATGVNASQVVTLIVFYGKEQ